MFSRKPETDYTLAYTKIHLKIWNESREKRKFEKQDTKYHTQSVENVSYWKCSIINTSQYIAQKIRAVLVNTFLEPEIIWLLFIFVSNQNMRLLWVCNHRSTSLWIRLTDAWKQIHWWNVLTEEPFTVWTRTLREDSTTSAHTHTHTHRGLGDDFSPHADYILHLLNFHLLFPILYVQ
jgi:hypothetical protein